MRHQKLKNKSHTMGRRLNSVQYLESVSFPLNHRHRIFLLSPANLAGIRASYVLRDGATSDLACRLRGDGVSLGELFSFISGLYFRGKLAYATAFSGCEHQMSGAYVITASGCLIPPETVVTLEGVRSMALTDIDAADPRYREPFDRSCQSLAEKVQECCEVVLLGSIATPKYVEPLLQVFGERLLFPVDFVGRGDMSRGGMLLRAVEAQKELSYGPVFNAERRGPRPPKLVPVVKRAST